MISTSALLERSPVDFATRSDVPPATQRVSLADLGTKSCRWPSGDPREPDFGFCGKTKLDGAPYCAEHAALAYARLCTI
jgi:GcrA cell cycle regulator